MKFSIRSSANQENIIHHQSTSANQSSPHTHTHTQKVLLNKVKERRISVCMFIMFKHVTGWVS